MAPELSSTFLAAALQQIRPNVLAGVSWQRRSVSPHSSQFWQPRGNAPMSERPMLVINRVLDGLEGKLTNATWARFGAIE